MANKASSASKQTKAEGTPAPDKSIQSFREAFDRSLTLSRDRIQDVVDDAVGRGRMTRGDANELVSRLVVRGRRYSDELLRDLEGLIERLRLRTNGERSEGSTGPAGAPEFPIAGYDELNAGEVRAGLTELSPEQLVTVRKRELAGKARKTVLAELDRRIAAA